MKITLSSVLVLVASLFLMGCWRPGQIVSSIGSDTLRDFALRAKDLEKSTLHEVPEYIWPDDLKRHRPKSVKFYTDGVKIEYSVVGSLAKGIFIAWNDERPYDASGIGFESIDHRIYSYEEKVRVPANRQ